MFIQVYSIQPCCMAACVCPPARHSLTRTCAPRRLQPHLIVCSCFAEKPEGLAVSSLVLSRPIPTPVLGRLPPGGSLLFNAASARASQSTSLDLRTKQPSAKARGNLVAQPNVRFKVSPVFLSCTPSVLFFLLASHTQICEWWHMHLAKHVNQVHWVQGLFFKMNFEALSKAERAALHLHFPILKLPFLFFQKAAYSTN